MKKRDRDIIESFHKFVFLILKRDKTVISEISKYKKFFIQWKMIKRM